jgi:hypothetical protein
MTTDGGIGRMHRGLAALAVALATTAAGAHDLPPKVVRELVRIQGYRASAPQAAQVVRELPLVVLGQQMRFAATEWRVFAFHDQTAKPTLADSAQLTLQGERAQLHSIASARPDQRITILAERRSGSSDLFLLSVDLCPQ